MPLVRRRRPGSPPSGAHRRRPIWQWRSASLWLRPLLQFQARRRAIRTRTLARDQDTIGVVPKIALHLAADAEMPGFDLADRQGQRFRSDLFHGDIPHLAPL